MRLQIYDSVKILFDNYKIKKKILLLRYNLSSIMVYFLKHKDSSNMLFKTHRKKIGKRNKKNTFPFVLWREGVIS